MKKIIERKTREGKKLFEISYSDGSVRKIPFKETFAKTREKIQLVRYRKRDLEEALRFLSWVSYGYQGNTDFPKNMEVTFKSKSEAMQQIKRNIQVARIQDYVQTPNPYEERAGVSKHVARKVRNIVTYLSETR